jgi:hypothetical protein
MSEQFFYVHLKFTPKSSGVEDSLKIPRRRGCFLKAAFERQHEQNVRPVGH